DLMRDPAQGAAHRFGIEDPNGAAFVYQAGFAHSFATSRDRVKGRDARIRRALWPASSRALFVRASWSDVSRSNRAALSQSRYRTRLFRSRSICVSKSPRAQRETL